MIALVPGFLPTKEIAPGFVYSYMEKSKHLLKGDRFGPSVEGGGDLALENQLEESLCSCCRIEAIDDRLDCRFSYSSDQLSSSRFHNSSENTVLGLSGRIPSITFFTTLASEDSPNGGYPVSTCGSGGMRL